MEPCNIYAVKKLDKTVTNSVYLILKLFNEENCLKGTSINT